MGQPKITIPKSCHESWNAMTPSDKVRFCSSCQKIVYDFTKSTDRMILQKVNSDENACGRFLTSQLDRELVIPRQKSTTWTVGIAGVLSLANFENNSLQAQTTHQTVQTGEQNQNVKLGEVVTCEQTVSGSVTDYDGLPIAFVTIVNLQTNDSTHTDSNGNFAIRARRHESIRTLYLDYPSITYRILDKTAGIELELILPHRTKTVTMGMIVSTKKRTFFGRIFYKIDRFFTLKWRP
jgi:hypothetical protein